MSTLTEEVERAFDLDTGHKVNEWMSVADEADQLLLGQCHTALGERLMLVVQEADRLADAYAEARLRRILGHYDA